MQEDSTTKDIERDFAREMQNFQEIARQIRPAPGDAPVLPGVEIHGVSIPQTGAVGGDHIVYLDFNKRFDLARRIAQAEQTGRADVAANLRRNRNRAGILLADVAGHSTTDALIAAMLHQAFLLGVYYELDLFGEITTKLFEHINTRFFRSNNVNKYFSMIYGEISTEGRFRFISSGHPPPQVFSREFRRFMPICPDRLVSFPPVGMFATKDDPDEDLDPTAYGYKKRHYEVNEIDLLASGDLLLLYTDGLSELASGDYFPARTEALLGQIATSSASEICERIRQDVEQAGALKDDVSFVVIKKR